MINKLIYKNKTYNGQWPILYYQCRYNIKMIIIIIYIVLLLILNMRPKNC